MELLERRVLKIYLMMCLTVHWSQMISIWDIKAWHLTTILLFLFPFSLQKGIWIIKNCDEKLCLSDQSPNDFKNHTIDTTMVNFRLNFLLVTSRWFYRVTSNLITSQTLLHFFFIKSNQHNWNASFNQFKLFRKADNYEIGQLLIIILLIFCVQISFILFAYWN